MPPDRNSQEKELLELLNASRYVDTREILTNITTLNYRQVYYLLNIWAVSGIVEKKRIPNISSGAPQHGYRLTPKGKERLYKEYRTKITRVAVKAVLIHDDLALLLIRDEQDSYKPGEYDLPGGAVEFGESAEDALLREIKEETDLAAEVIYPVRTWNTIKDKTTQYIGITYLALTESNRVELSEEHNDFKWVDVDVLSEYDLADWLEKDLEAGIKIYRNTILQNKENDN